MHEVTYPKHTHLCVRGIRCIITSRGGVLGMCTLIGE